MQPRPQGFSLKTRVGREKVLASAGHVHSLNIPEKLIYVQPASQTMSIFSRVWDSKAQDPFNWALFKCYKFMKGRTGSTLSRTKYIKCFIVETSCYRLVLWLNFIVTVELLYDQVESDFVQCQTTMRAFASRIEPDWNRIVHQNGSWILVFSTTRPWNKQISAPDASQPSSQERWQVADLKHLKTSDIFSLPRISTKDFPYIKGKIDWSIGINYSSVNFKWTQVFLCCQSFDRRGQWIF